MKREDLQKSPLAYLDAQELEFITRFVLASGSLKEVAKQYGVSYPTLRGRLDKLIEKLRQARAERKPDEVLDLMADLIEAGEITISGAKRLREAYRKKFEEEKQNG
jgi:hypothetical protein